MYMREELVQFSDGFNLTHRDVCSITDFGCHRHVSQPGSILDARKP